MPPGSILLSSGFATLSICFSSHVTPIALLPEVVLASAPDPICSKIWEVCFDVNTILDDSPINSGGATRSRHCSLLGGATRTRSDAATCVLPSDATRTRHDDAFSSKRLTVPCDSDSVCQSDPRWPRIATRLFAHSAQHNFLGQFFCCPRCVLTCTQSFRVCLASEQPGFQMYR